MSSVNILSSYPSIAVKFPDQSRSMLIGNAFKMADPMTIYPCDVTCKPSVQYLRDRHWKGWLPISVPSAFPNDKIPTPIQSHNTQPSPVNCEIQPHELCEHIIIISQHSCEVCGPIQVNVDWADVGATTVEVSVDDSCYCWQFGDEIHGVFICILDWK